MAKITDATLAPYATALNHWPKAAGDKPTAEALSIIHSMNIRAGKHALANAMYLRADGATDAQVRLAAAKLDTRGGLQGSLFNYMRRLCDDGLMQRDMTQPRGVYKITLTSKGEAQVARYHKAADVPVQPVSAVRAKPAKARKAKAPTLPTQVDTAASAPVNTAPISDGSVLIPAQPQA